MQETSNIKLNTYDETDSKVKYRDFRLAIAGTANSNMTKIDKAYGELKNELDIATEQDILEILAIIK